MGSPAARKACNRVSSADAGEEPPPRRVPKMKGTPPPRNARNRVASSDDEDAPSSDDEDTPPPKRIPKRQPRVMQSVKSKLFALEQRDNNAEYFIPGLVALTSVMLALLVLKRLRALPP